MFFNLKGKTAFVTGGASGLGLAIAKRFSEAGASVAICDLQDGKSVAAELGGAFIQADVSQPAQLESALQTARSEIGDMDILVNNAGINGKDGVAIVDSDIELTRRLFEINVLGVYYGLKFGPSVMNDGGSIINTASLGASLVFPGSGPYSATKASVISLTQMSATELTSRRIRVNAVAPSFIRTAMAAEDMALFDKIGEHATLTGRIAEPEEVAAVYHFLAADDATYINGQVIYVDGGMSLGFTESQLKLIAKD